MVFNSVEFAVFLPLVLGFYWLLPHRAQNVLLLVASYIFYGAWDHRFLSLLLFSTIIDFLVGLRLETATNEARRRLLLVTSVVVQIGLLAFFKYYGFFIDSAADLLHGIGLEPHLPVLKVVLPVGISFYTFQTLSYTIDIYRRRLRPTKSFLNFAVFVAFFPHLVAGPIFRARLLLPQIEEPRARPSSFDIRSGLFLMLWGLFKKVAIADAVAPIANAAFASPSDATSATLLLGMYAFALQIYGDFSGYTDIARGVSRLFGIQVMRNFEQPYLSRNITEFWRTWHISLSTWLHDYLYVPLGGNKRGVGNTYRNLLLTMLLGGLWHGAAWTFVVWGGIHGLMLAVHRKWGRYTTRGDRSRLERQDILAMIGTFHLVAFSWIFFRADTLSAAMSYIQGIFSRHGLLPSIRNLFLVAGSLTLTLAIDVAQRRADQHAVVLQWRPLVRGIVYATLFLGVVIWSGGETRQFIYFQF